MLECEDVLLNLMWAVTLVLITLTDFFHFKMKDEDKCVLCLLLSLHCFLEWWSNAEVWINSLAVQDRLRGNIYPALPFIAKAVSTAMPVMHQWCPLYWMNLWFESRQKLIISGVGNQCSYQTVKTVWYYLFLIHFPFCLQNMSMLTVLPYISAC